MLIETENKLYHFIRALRPRQWIKNVFIFAPLIFAGKLFDPTYFGKTFVAFIYFSAIASGIYLINDIVDLAQDRKHPIKRNRPIASGRVSVLTAKIAAALIIFVFLITSFSVVGRYFGFVLTAYFLLQVVYNLKLKNVIILDALTISIGFILRVYAGALATSTSVSSWMILAVIGISLLLAFGKRRAERTLLTSKAISKEDTRKILRQYPDSLLDSMISMSAAYSIITYSLFVFQTSPIGIGSAGTLFLPATLITAKWLMITIPLVIYSVARYLFVIYEKKEGESPDRILIQDKPLLTSTILTGLIVIIMMNSVD